MEYSTDTKDRFWECPHCGRKRENHYYPFLNARIMQARIEGDGGNWEDIYDNVFEEALVKVQERNVRLRRLASDLDIPVEEVSSDHVPTIEAMRADGDAENKEWRARFEALLKSTRTIILAQEDKIEELDAKKAARRSKKEG